MELIAAKKNEIVLKEKDFKLKSLLAKYGGSKHLKIPAEVKHISNDLNDSYVIQAHKIEFGLVGIQSRYEEDVYLGKHRSVWGSAYDIETKQWGFKCCMCFDRTKEECIGTEGKIAYQTLLRASLQQKDSDAEEHRPVRRRLDELDPQFVDEMTEKGLDAHAVHDFLIKLEQTPECLTLEPGKIISKEELEAYRIKRMQSSD